MRVVKAERVVDLAASHLRDAILDGEFAGGSFLPAERALAALLGVNRLTLRAAIARLEAEGLLRPEHGNGVRVLDLRASGGLAVLPHLVGHADVAVIEGFLELRRIIGAEAVVLCAERAGEHVRADLRRLAALQAAEADRAAFARRDLQFVRALVEGTGNLALLLLLNTVEAALHARPDLTEAMIGDLDEVRGSYAEVAALVATGPAPGARDAVRLRLAAQDARTLERLAAAGEGGVS
jgi:GntR family transcriptional repressor for pyruvate dehydrogenase complex